jgi:hypothetical protein
MGFCLTCCLCATQSTSLYLFIKFSIEQLIGTDKFIYFSTNGVIISLNYLVSLYSPTTATYFEIEKIIFIKVVPLACTLTLMN